MDPNIPVFHIEHIDEPPCVRGRQSNQTDLSRFGNCTDTFQDTSHRRLDSTETTDSRAAGTGIGERDARSASSTDPADNMNPRTHATRKRSLTMERINRLINATGGRLCVHAIDANRQEPRKMQVVRTGNCQPTQMHSATGLSEPRTTSYRSRIDLINGNR